MLKKIFKERKERTREEIEKEHEKIGSTYSHVAFLCQAFAFGVFVALIPQAEIKNEYLFMFFLVLGAIASLVAYGYAAFENDYWKDIKKIKEAQAKEQGTDVTADDAKSADAV